MSQNSVVSPPLTFVLKGADFVQLFWHFPNICLFCCLIVSFPNHFPAVQRTVWLCTTILFTNHFLAVWWTVWLCTNILSPSHCLAVRRFVRCCTNILFSNHFLAVPWIVCDYVRLFCLLTISFSVRCIVWLCMVISVYKPLCCFTMNCVTVYEHSVS